MSCPGRGTSAVVTNVGAGCGGRFGVVARFTRVDERRGGVRRSRVVLTPRCWRQVLERQRFPGMTVTKTPGHRGEHEGNRRTIAQGMPVETGEPVARPGHFLPKPRVHRTPGIPCALFLEGRKRLFLEVASAPLLRGRAPSSFRADDLQNSGVRRRENAEACDMQDQNSRTQNSSRTGSTPIPLTRCG
jgi:hypothetical protein